MPTANNELFLTFDDGPIPEVTPWVFDQLAKYDAKATFFCVGDNVRKYPELLDRMHKEGHTSANHTNNHLSGWSTENLEYFHNIRECAERVDSDLFRPPYGRMKPGQAQFLLRHYKVIMWDVLSADFDNTVTEQQCLDNVLRNAGAGSIVVMHDSLKAERNLRYALPRILDHFSHRGYTFKAIDGSEQIVEKGMLQTA